MSDHKLDASAQTVHWGYFDASLKPALTIESGDRVTVSSVSGAADQMPDAPFAVPAALRDQREGISSPVTEPFRAELVRLLPQPAIVVRTVQVE